jgi:hypothetical protein
MRKHDVAFAHAHVELTIRRSPALLKNPLDLSGILS